MKLAPLVLFTYNRPDHTRQTIESLQKNELAQECNLYIYSDGAKDESDRFPVEETRSYLITVSGFKSITITEKRKNFGLAKSIISGVSEVIEKYERVIVLEDDLVSSPYFIRFMNEALEYYEGNKDMISVSGYRYPFEVSSEYKESVLALYRFCSWGWATWKDRWESVDWDVKDYGQFINSKVERSLFNRGGTDLTRMLEKQIRCEIDSWAIRFAYHHYKCRGMALFPTKTLITNIGHDGTGTHCRRSDKWQEEMIGEEWTYDFIETIRVDKGIQRSFLEFMNDPFYKRVIRKLFSFAPKITRKS